MNKYIAGSYPDIKRIEITRESDASIWVETHGKERRLAKVTEYSAALDTFDEAKSWLIDREKGFIAGYETRIAISLSKIAKYSSLTNPDE